MFATASHYPRTPRSGAKLSLSLFGWGRSAAEGRRRSKDKLEERGSLALIPLPERSRAQGGSGGEATCEPEVGGEGARPDGARAFSRSASGAGRRGPEAGADGGGEETLHSFHRRVLRRLSAHGLLHAGPDPRAQPTGDHLV